MQWEDDRIVDKSRTPRLYLTSHITLLIITQLEMVNVYTASYDNLDEASRKIGSKGLT